MLTTFGHSTLEPQAAVALLDGAGVDVLVDVRSHPTSRWDWWRREELQRWVPELTAGQIEYEWWPELGGWDVRHAQDPALVKAMAAVGVDLAAYGSGSFPKHRIAKQITVVVGPLAEGSPVWTNQGLWDYAWFTGLPEFRAGIDRAINRFGNPAGPTCALMCSETLWWKCHRSMIADVLVARGAEAYHLQPRWTNHRAALGNRLDRYPAAVRAAWGT